MTTASAPLPVASPRTTGPRLAMFGLGVWALVSSIVAASGVISIERPFLIPLALFGSVVALVALYVRAPPLRALADGVDLRVPILFHVVRAPIGAAFLVLMASGLDADFARIAGWGDIVSGTLALVAAAFVGRPSERTVVRAWNALGLADILVVVVTAQRIILFSDHPETMALLAGFPFALLPLFFVPLVIATHFLIFRRTSRSFVPRV